MADEHQFGAELVTPESALFAGGASAVILRTSDGDLTVLDGHTDLVGDVVPTVVRIETAEGTEAFCVHGGFVQVRTAKGAAAGLLGDDETRSTRVSVLAGIAERVADLDVARAQAAREAASAELAGLPADDQDDEAAAKRQQVQGALARAELRLEAAGASVSS